MSGMLGSVTVRRVKLTDMNPAPYNPRRIRDDAFEGLSQSIDRFGLLSLIIWNERTGNIVGGHQRYKKLVRDGETETDVVVVNLNSDDEVALNVTLNNPEIRGDFTKEVVGMLELVEVQIGNAFDSLGLSDLHNYVKRLKFDDEKDKQDSGSKDKDKDDGDDVPQDDEETDIAVVSCPRCGSMWNMSDEKVIFNALEAAKKAVGDEVED